jgi:hypothetical protein
MLFVGAEKEGSMINNYIYRAYEQLTSLIWEIQGENSLVYH